MFTEKRSCGSGRALNKHRDAPPDIDPHLRAIASTCSLVLRTRVPSPWWERAIFFPPSPGGRELEGGGFAAAWHPHPGPLPSRERENPPFLVLFPKVSCTQHKREKEPKV